jgi:hypothetical protein
MIRKIAIGSGLALAMAVGSQMASAATIGPHSKMQAGESLIQQIQGGRYCRYVRFECAERWGWNTRPFYICLERRGCLY